MTTQALTAALYHAGLLQFGRFVVHDATQPFQHHLSMLASYPDLLRMTAAALAPRVQGVDRLLCAEECVPLATALSLESGVPLVIGRGRGHDGARDFAGAFDIGHPAALVVHALDEVQVHLVQHARLFGLDIQRIVGVLDYGAPSPDWPSSAALDLGLAVWQLVAENELPAGLGRAVECWLAERAIRPRPD
jgi:hypothetical protein